MDPSSPPAEILDTLDLIGTIGMGYLGVVISSLIYGITCLQTFQYYRSHRAQTDLAHIKAFVCILWILDTIHQALVIHSYYVYLITGYAMPEKLLVLVWSIPSSIFVNGISSILVRSFFLLRIWRLSRNKALTVGLGTLALARVGLSTAYFARGQFAYHHHFFVAETNTRPIGLANLSLEVITNLLYAGTLAILLYRERTGMRRSNNIITNILVLVVSSSMLSAIVAIGEMIAYAVAPTKLYTLVFDFFLEAVDANAALTSLNSRERLRDTGPESVSAVMEFENTIPLSSLRLKSVASRNLSAGNPAATNVRGPEVNVKIEKASYVV